MVTNMSSLFIISAVSTEYILQSCKVQSHSTPIYYGIEVMWPTTLHSKQQIAEGFPRSHSKFIDFVKVKDNTGSASVQPTTWIHWEKTTANNFYKVL